VRQSKGGRTSQNGGAGSPGGVAIDDQGRRWLRTPARNHSVICLQFREGAKGDGGGRRGGLIAAVRHRLRQVIKRIDDGE
jgi:hypothetical protein